MAITFLRVNPIQLIFWANVIAGVIAPLLVILILILAPLHLGTASLHSPLVGQDAERGIRKYSLSAIFCLAITSCHTTVRWVRKHHERRLVVKPHRE